MTYVIAKQVSDALNDAVVATSKALATFPTGAMNLVSDATKASPEWRAAKGAFDTAFARLRAFTPGFQKAYKKEIAAERKARRGF